MDYARHYGLPDQKPSGLEMTYVEMSTRFRRYDYAIKALRAIRSWEADTLYTRLPQAAALGSWSNIPTIFEIHDLPSGRIGPWLFRSFLIGKDSFRLVSISQALLDDLKSTYRFPNKEGFSLVAPDGVDLYRYQELLEPSEAREVLNLPQKYTAGYTGHLYQGRGIDILLETAGLLPDIQFLIVGGNPSDVSRVNKQIKKQNIENVILTGFVPNKNLPLYQAASDVLLMPYQKKVSGSSGGDIAKYLSPMKMFEYLACGRPILSSDLPVLQEILSDSTAVILSSNDPQVWAESIQSLQNDPEKSAVLSSNSLELIQNYTWVHRVQSIFNR